MLEQASNDLYKAIDNNHHETILKLSRKLDRLIVEYLLKIKLNEFSKGN
jgi:hypothetical protein